MKRREHVEPTALPALSLIFYIHLMFPALSSCWPSLPSLFFSIDFLFSPTLSYCSLPFLLQMQKMVSAILMEAPTEGVTESKQSWAYCGSALNLGQPYEHQATLLLSYCVCSLHKGFKGHCTWAGFQNDFSLLSFILLCAIETSWPVVGTTLTPQCHSN